MAEATVKAVLVLGAGVVVWVVIYALAVALDGTVHHRKEDDDAG